MSVVDLWGEPVPEQAPLPDMLGPHHLDIPAWCADWVREQLLALPLPERDRRIQRLNAAENRREKARKRERERRSAGNPLLIRLGPGPEGATCGGCVHLFAKRYAGTYHKCELRGDTNGPGTDHRVRWPACGRYEAHIAAAAVAAGGSR